MWKKNNALHLKIFLQNPIKERNVKNIIHNRACHWKITKNRVQIEKLKNFFFFGKPMFYACGNHCGFLKLIQFTGCLEWQESSLHCKQATLCNPWLQKPQECLKSFCVSINDIQHLFFSIHSFLFSYSHCFLRYYFFEFFHFMCRIEIPDFSTSPTFFLCLTVQVETSARMTLEIPIQGNQRLMHGL